VTINVDEPAARREAVSACDALSGLAQTQSAPQRLLDTQPLASFEIAFSFLNINLVVCAGALASLEVVLSDRRHRAEAVRARLLQLSIETANLDQHGN
jgi:hypothetical protein